MNVDLVSNDVDLKQALSDSGYFDYIQVKANINDATEQEVLIISDRLVHYNSLSNFIPTPEQKHVFYMVSNMNNKRLHEQIYTLCKSKNIHVISPKHGVQQIVEDILSFAFPNYNLKNGNVFLFMGSDSRVGTSMVAQSIAEDLDLHVTNKKKIGLFFLDGKPNDNYTPEGEAKYLDNLKTKILNKMLSEEDLINGCFKRNDLYILNGLQYYPDMREYTPDVIESLIDLGSNIFDILLVDVGSNLDCGMTVAGLHASQNKFLVTTQMKSSLKAFERTKNILFKYFDFNEEDFYLIVNKYIKQSGIYSENEVSDFYKMVLAGSIANLDYQGWQAEFDCKTLYNYENQEYKQQISSISQIITSKSGQQYYSSFEQKDSFLKKIMSFRR